MRTRNGPVSVCRLMLSGARATSPAAPDSSADQGSAGSRLQVCSAVLHLDMLTLEFGGTLHDVNIAYSLFGNSRLPLVIVLGGISAGRDVCAGASSSVRGWWQDLAGEGLAVDTGSFCVLGIDFLGGACASTRAAGLDFPPISSMDQAAAISAVLDHLGVARAYAIIGSSYGGMVALAFASRFPSRVERIAVISAAHESHPMATALRTLQRQVVRLGLENGCADEALAIARGIAMTSYRTAEEFARRFKVTPRRTADRFQFPVESYLAHQGASFADRFPPWSFLCLSESIDLHRVDPASIPVPATLVAIDSDSLVPVWQMRALAAAMAGPVTSIEIRSVYGHDAFLKERDVMAGIIRNTLRGID